MPIVYVVNPKVNPSDKEATPKYYAQARSRGELTFRRLSKEIAEGSTTVSDTDVLAVLNDLAKLLRRHLENGEIVRFGDFGSFQITISSDGSATAEEFHSALIKKPKVTFRPGIDLKELLPNLRYEKAK